jgi:hypothetical protein
MLQGYCMREHACACGGYVERSPTAARSFIRSCFNRVVYTKGLRTNAANEARWIGAKALMMAPPALPLPTLALHRS